MTIEEKSHKYVESFNYWDEPYTKYDIREGYVNGAKEAINLIDWKEIKNNMINSKENVYFYSSREQINEEFITDWFKEQVEKQLK